MSYFSAGRSYLAGGPANSVTRVAYDGIATAGQTVISPPGGVAPGMNDVFVGGACLSAGDYTDSNGVSIILAKSMALGTQYRVVAYGKLGDVTLNPNLYVLKSGDTMTGTLTTRSLTLSSQGNNYTYPITFDGGVGNRPSLNYQYVNKSIYFADAANANANFSIADNGNVSVRGAMSALSGSFNGPIGATSAQLTAALFLNGASSASAVQFAPGGGLRYFLGWDGTNFTMNRYNGSGTYLSTPFYVRDTDGTVVVPNFLATNLTTTGLTVGSGITCTGNSIELGPAAAGPAYIDLHSSGTGVDYDCRMIATGGSATLGSGTLDFYGASVNARVSSGFFSVYSPTTLGVLRLWAGNYGPMIRSNSGTSAIEFINSANSAVNATFYDAGSLTLRGGLTTQASSTLNGTTSHAGTLWMQGANSIRLDGGGYSGFLRGDTSGLVGFINQAQNAWTFQVKDSGFVKAINGFVWGDDSNTGGQYNGTGSNGAHTENTGTLCIQSGGVNLHFGHPGAGGTQAQFWVTGASVGSISSSTTATSFNTSSDYRLKKNVANLTGGLERVMRLRPVEFDWILNGESSRGFLAHELADVEPNAVTGTKDALMKALHDPDGPDVPDYQQVDSSFCIPDMVAAIQELSAKLDAALTRIATLEGAA